MQRNTFMTIISKLPRGYAFAGLLLAGAAFWPISPSVADPAVAVPARAIDEPNPASSETAVVSGGCFWGVQAVFQHVKGVSEALSGYSGGSKANAHYEIVGTGQTGPAEPV